MYKAAYRFNCTSTEKKGYIRFNQLSKGFRDWYLYTNHTKHYVVTSETIERWNKDYWWKIYV